MSNPERLEEIFHCVRCDKELHLSDYFFTVWLSATESRKYGVHATCLKTHDDVVK